MYEHLFLYSDGGCRLYLKKAAYAFLIMDDESNVICQDSQRVSGDVITGNSAEYTALIKGLENAVGLAKRLTVVSDSQLMISQMKGDYKINASHLIELHKKATMLCSTFDEVAFEWRPREDKWISVCDRLCDDCIEKV